MGKAPAFQLYAKDIYTGTSEMSSAAFGAYCRALCWSWDNGPLPLDSYERRRALLVDESEWDRIWAKIAPLWREGAAGYTNDRLEEQRQTQKDFSDAQSERGKNGAAKRWGAKRNGASNGACNARALAQAQPDNSSAICDLQSSTRESKDHSLSNARANPHAKATNLINGRDNLKHGEHAYCLQGRRESLCVSTTVMALLVDSVGGDKDAAKRWLMTEVMPKAVEALGDKPVPDGLVFWKGVVKQAIERRSTPAHELYDPDAGRRTKEMLAASKRAAGF